VVVTAASAATPRLRYPVGKAKSLRRLRAFVPAGIFDRTFRHRFALDT
jgi:hypothetical protein